MHYSLWQVTWIYNHENGQHYAADLEGPTLDYDFLCILLYFL